MTAPQQPTPVGQPAPPRPAPVGQPVNPVDFFRRMPGGGTVYVKPTPDPRGFIPPHPTPEQARHVNDAIRSDDFYPCQVGIFCDRCGDTVEADYIVGADDDQPTRFGIARAHLRTVGWSCDERGDYCPDHVAVSRG